MSKLLGLTAALMLATAAPTVAHADVSFLEAGVFFMTGVEPAPTDQVSESRIVLAKYSMVAYRTDSNPCAVRIRITTQPFTMWQMDFCQVTQAQWLPTGGNGFWVFAGKQTAFCRSELSADEDYMGDMRKLADPKYTIVPTMSNTTRTLSCSLSSLAAPTSGWI